MSSFRASPSPPKSRRVAVGKRHQARELALKVLFQLEGQGGSAGGSAPRDHPREGGEAPPLSDDPEEVVRYHSTENGATEDIANFARELVRGVLGNQETLDSIRTEASQHCKIAELAE